MDTNIGEQIKESQEKLESFEKEWLRMLGSLRVMQNPLLEPDEVMIMCGENVYKKLQEMNNGTESPSNES